jgi:hypothetical protein
MNRSELFSSLLAATGTLHPAGETTATELDDLRRAFLQRFEHASPPPVATSGSPSQPRLAAELDYLVAQHLSAGPRTWRSISLPATLTERRRCAMPIRNSHWRLSATKRR